jgi:hypothetical protein
MRIEDAGHAQANAMVTDSGDWFYPDDAEDARHFAEGHGAEPANPDAFRAMFGEDWRR